MRAFGDNALELLFRIDGGLTFLSGPGLTAWSAAVPAWLATDRAYVDTSSSTADETRIVVFHGQIAPTGVPTQSLQDVISSVTVPGSVRLWNKAFLVPIPGDFSLVITRNPNVVAALARVGGDTFVDEQNSDPQVVSKAKAVAMAPLVVHLPFFATPLGLGLVVVAAACGYMMFKKKRPL
jgi:hypothetical protein